MTANGYTGNPPGSGGGGGTDIDPAATVVSETTYGQTATAGNAASYSRGNHTHGTPALPTPAAIGASSTAHNHVGVYDPAGTAASTVAAHVAAGDPHAQYATDTDLSTGLALKANLAGPTFTGTVSGITKAMVGLGNVDNTADTAKPVSTAQQTALDLKAPLASPALTGNPTAPTQTAGNNSTRLATTAYVEAAVAAGGGGGGTAPTFSRAYVTSGDIAMPNDASWTPVSGLTLAIAAVAGDDVEIELNCMLHSGGGADNFYDLVVLVGGSIVRAASTGTATPATEGDPALYPSTNVLFRGSTTSFGFTTVPGDISGGNVTFGLAHKGPGGGTPKVYASTSYPLRWRARNDH